MSAGFKVAEAGMPPRPTDKYDAPSLLGNQGQRRFHVMAKPSGPPATSIAVTAFT